MRESDRRHGPYPYYGASGIVDHVADYIFEGEHLLIAEDGENLRTRNTPIAFLASGRFWVNNHAHIVRGNQHAITRYLCYALQRADVSGYLTGSTLPKLTQGSLNRIPVPTPPLAEQRSIAAVLGSLDDKIDLNRRMNATLEATARAIFKAWFVDFEALPVETKQTDLVAMVAEMGAIRYGGGPRRVQSSRGRSPAGWTTSTLGEQFEVTRGLSYKGAGLSGAGVPLHNLNSIHEGGGYKYEGIKHYIGEYAPRHVARPGDVIVANTEQGHDRLLIGYSAVVPPSSGSLGLFSHHLYRLRPRDRSPLTGRFISYLLNSAVTHDLVSGFANGTTVNMLPIDGVESAPVVVPSRPAIEAFDRLAAVVEARREVSIAESTTLVSLRDTILPKLLSGEVLVKDVA